MLKSNRSLKIIDSQAIQTLRSLLEIVPALKLVDIVHEVPESESSMEIVAHIRHAGKNDSLICAVQPSGQPRHIRMALLELRHSMLRHPQAAIPVLIAPYLSPQVQALCRAQGVGYLDLEGNACLIFGSVFIERQVASKPAAERRELKSLFKPKSAQVLRVMLSNPRRSWRVAELAQAAAVSLGQVSNVRVGLLAREWAQVSEDGLFLSAPDALLGAWCKVYEPPAGKRLSFYTTLHGSAFEEAARRVLAVDETTGLAAFASFSAAHWLAPYGRTGTHYFYADQAGLEHLQSALKLTATSKGENVVVSLLKDADFLRDTVEPAPGAICTSPLQTYLDLANAGERGREAAEHLRRERLTGMK